DSIENAQLELGKALMEGLEDYEAAIKTLEAFCERFGYSDNRAKALSYLYYCYLKTGDTAKAATVKKELEEKYADKPEAQKIINPTAPTENNKLESSMNKSYDEIYSLFIEGNFQEALAEKKIADSLYSTNYWTPQLLYIQSIYFIKEKLDDSAKTSLQNIVNLYPSTVLAAKAQTMIDVLGRRKEIEEYLTKLKIEGLEDTTSQINTSPAIDTKPGVVVKGNKADSAVVIAKPLISDKALPGQRKDSTQMKPTQPLRVAFVLDPTVPHYVAVIMDKVDGVFINEAKNAFNRYNKQYYYNKPIETTSEVINDTIRLVLMNTFENTEAAFAYIEKTSKVAAAEIIPWLPVTKYAFAVISSTNLELLKNSKDIQEYRRFLQQSFPGKFK
ncbi:MAG: tetratricopeptide repeat protein, partial [Chitinophagaceae bacterium]